MPLREARGVLDAGQGVEGSRGESSKSRLTPRDRCHMHRLLALELASFELSRSWRQRLSSSLTLSIAARPTPPHRLLLHTRACSSVVSPPASADHQFTLGACVRACVHLCVCECEYVCALVCMCAARIPSRQ